MLLLFLLHVCEAIVSMEMIFFPSIFVPLPFSLCMESTPYVFPFSLMVFCYIVTTSWVLTFLACCVRIQSIQAGRPGSSEVTS